jgi:hypothetical protein
VRETLMRSEFKVAGSRFKVETADSSNVEL